jgi:hypothetical protein
VRAPEWGVGVGTWQDALWHRGTTRWLDSQAKGLVRGVNLAEFLDWARAERSRQLAARAAGEAAQGAASEAAQGRGGQDNLCIVCTVELAHATFVHGAEGHTVCCMSCAAEVQRRGLPCPVCRALVERVIRNFRS